jgi:hypothetical protein
MTPGATMLRLTFAVLVFLQNPEVKKVLLF